MSIKQIMLVILKKQLQVILFNIEDLIPKFNV